MSALAIEGYTLDYATRGRTLRVLDDVSLRVEPGEVLGLVGESGSGKTSLAWAILRSLPGNARERSGSIQLGADRLTGMDAGALARLRGRRVSMVFQDPSTALNPTLTLGRQMTEVLRRHRGMDRAAAWAESIALLRRVDIADPEALLRRYPHEASGGEKQRVVIATAFACQPELVVLDEPTTALDVITGARVLDLLRRLRTETGVAALYISHDLGLVARIADRVAVLQRGRVVEQARASTVFRMPSDAYTRALVAAVPRPSVRLVDTPPAAATLLSVAGLGVAYVRKTLFGSSRSIVVQDVTLAIREGEIMGLVGESGSGKSSLARAITGLAAYDGQIALRGHPVRRMDGAYRRAVQIVFQHPDGTLNPRHRVAEILARPLRLFGGARAEIPRLLEQVALPASFATRYPHQLSGGEKQRVAIARAFAARPALVVCDEPTASLDVSVQAAVVRLLLELRRQHGTAYLFITHDLNLIRQIAHRVGVMRHGRVVELLDAERMDSAVHPYTQALLAACPDPAGLGDS